MNASTVLRRVHECNIHGAFDNAAHQVVLKADFTSDGYVEGGLMGISPAQRGRKISHKAMRAPIVMLAR